MNKIEKTGDLLKEFALGHCQGIMHCCNDCGIMGSGIAYGIKDQFPDAYNAYKAFEGGEGLELGTISWVDYVSSGKSIYNLHAQHLFNKTGEVGRCVDYEALYLSLLKVRAEFKGGILGVPYKMAADRAGGDWNIVEAMIVSVFEDTDVDILIVKYDK